MPATLAALQNGSDIRGVAAALPGGRPVNLTQGVVFRIAAAFATWAAQQSGRETGSLRIGVGHDPRKSAPSLMTAALSGIAASGASPFDCGLASTPAMFLSTLYPETQFDAAVMLTASHLPAERNGMKFFTRAGGLSKGDIADLLACAEALPEPSLFSGSAPPVDLLSLYTADLRRQIRRAIGNDSEALPLAGLKIAVDAGNGAGGFFAYQVLAPLGADIAGSQFLEPDGVFPHHLPNPEDPAAMAALRRAVLESRADLGLLFDTDVDRMAAVLPDGRELGRDALIAMMASILAPDYPGATVVTDSVTSDHLTVFLERQLGLRHRRFMRGYQNVIGEAKRLEASGIRAPLAIETSGHGALSENYFLDDGAYLAVRLIAAAAQAGLRGGRLADRIAMLGRAHAAVERRIPVTAPDFAAAGQAALDAFLARAKERGITVADSCEGVRLTFPKRGWMLLRLSLHDPLLPLNLEGNAPGDAEALLEVAASLLNGLPGLDCSVLRRPITL